MTTPDPNRRALLDDVLADSTGASGLTKDAVLEVVRHEKAARGRRHAMLIVTVCSALLLLSIAIPLRKPPFTTSEAPGLHPTAALPSLPATPSPTPAFRIERIDDQGLLEMLDGQAAALVKLPDNQRRLLLVVQHQVQ